ncbi:MAG: hypothetical protein ACFE0S_13370 [Rhodospirillales bacterium]
MKIETSIPPRRYLARDEAAAWLGVSVDTFNTLNIPYCDFGPRTKRWDVVDIVSYANDTKRCDSARTSDLRRRQRCDSTNAKDHPSIGSIGETRTAKDTARALGLKINS